MVLNIEEGLPFEDNSVDYIYSEHCLEHVCPCKWKYVLSEIARVAADGCILELKLPFDNIATRGNFDHFRTFNWNSFSQLEVGSNRYYYSPLKLIKLHKKPNVFVMTFFCMFPLLKPNWEVCLKFEIVKSEKP